jgi:hypothetical protein
MDKGQVEYMMNRCTLPDTCSNEQFKQYETGIYTK